MITDINIEQINPSKLQEIDSNKIIITKNDYNYIPSLSRFIPVIKFTERDYVYLNEFNNSSKSNIIREYFIKYNIVQRIPSMYFDYTSIRNFYPSDEKLNDILNKYKDLSNQYTINGDTIYYVKNGNEYILYSELSKNFDDLFYLGTLFFFAYNKIKDDINYHVFQSDYMSDINSLTSITPIQNIKDFLFQELKVFIMLSPGSIPFCNGFGSTVSNLVQSKNIDIYLEQSVLEIKSFIEDFSVIYDNSITFKNILFNVNDRELEISVIVSINNENILYRYIKGD